MELKTDNPLFTLTIGQFTELLQQTIEDVWEKNKSLLVADFRLSQSPKVATAKSKTSNSKKETSEKQFDSSILQQVILERVAVLETLIRQQVILQKEMLTTEEACVYTGLSQSYMYKLTADRIFPVYKPGGKLTFIKRTDLDAFLIKNRSKSNIEMKAEVANKLHELKTKTKK